jgi:hypothetical protein
MTCSSKAGRTDTSPVNGRLWEAISTMQAATAVEDCHADGSGASVVAMDDGDGQQDENGK